MRDVLLALLLSGLMGLLGQGVRAAVGLKSAATLSAGAPTQQSQFNAAYFGLSLMIGFIPGVLAGIGVGLDNIINIKPTAPGNTIDIKVLLGLAAAGYAGADFIENAFTRLIPGIGGQQQQQTAGSATAAPAPPPPPQPAGSPAGAEITGLGAALHTVTPRVNTSVWSPALSAAFTKYGMTGHRPMAAAVGQFLVEAGAAFQETAENLN